jgi:hypothetical protein
MQVKHLTTLALAGAFVLAMGAVHAEHETKRPEGQGPFAFALIGDTPYIASNMPGTPYPQFDRLVGSINADKQVKWVLHAGDIKNGSTVCSDELFLDRLARFAAIERPLVYTPGDNEWTDCHRLNNGQYQPLERLARLRELFFPVPGMTLGRVPMRVESQAHMPGYAEFPENVRWAHNGVLFVTLHIVGSSNALAPFQAGSSVVRTAADDEEVVRRNAANLTWLNAAFDQAEHDGAPGILFMIQANPGLEFDQSVADRYGFEAFLDALESRTQAYGKPVVLAHGDSHFFRVDKPRLLNRPFLPNLTRVETFGAGNVHWIRVSVDPRAPEVFGFEQRIVEGNP